MYGVIRVMVNEVRRTEILCLRVYVENPAYKESINVCRLYTTDNFIRMKKRRTKKGEIRVCGISARQTLNYNT